MRNREGGATHKLGPSKPRVGGSTPSGRTDLTTRTDSGISRKSPAAAASASANVSCVQVAGSELGRAEPLKSEANRFDSEIPLHVLRRVSLECASSCVPEALPRSDAGGES